jgi:hypothetical protein
MRGRRAAFYACSGRRNLRKMTEVQLLQHATTNGISQRWSSRHLLVTHPLFKPHHT